MTSTEDLRQDRGERPGPVRPRRAGDAVDGGFAEHVAVRVDRRSHRPVVVVSGELDASGAPLLEALLQHVTDQGAQAPVLVDLGAVRFADTHGLAPVLDGATEVRAASTAVRRVLRLLGLPAPRPPGPVPSR